MSAIKEHYHNEIEAGIRPDEHPILFSTEMVKAILEGRKTMTRRVVKNIENGSRYLNEYPAHEAMNMYPFIEPSEFQKPDNNKIASVVSCPYGKPGDLLWVRETWTGDIFSGSANAFVYKATSPNHRNCQERKLSIWKPSIHMPKAAARIWLQVEEVRVERLQDISEEDAKAEGVKIHSRGNFYLDYVAEAFNTTQFIYRLPSAKQSFKTLWELINERRKNFIEKHGITWIDNPWVWVVKYKVLSTTGKPSFPRSIGTAQDDGSNDAQDDK